MIPGYAGYRPQIRVNNHHLGKTVTEQSREVFKPEILDKPTNQLATTGFNHALIPKFDAELHETSSKYGRPTMMRNASNMNTVELTTTARASYMRPASAPRPNWRERDSTI